MTPSRVAVSVDDGDLARADLALKRFEAAFLVESGYVEAGADIAAAAGIPDFEAALRSGDPVRPWRWLTAVGQRAAVSGDRLLAARVFFFTEFWRSQIAPLLTPADMVETNIGQPPDELYGQIAVTGLRAVVELPEADVVAPGQGGSVTVELLRRAAAHRVVELDEKDGQILQGDPGAVDLARKVLRT